MVYSSSVSQPVGRGPLVGLGALLVGRQAFLILLKMRISDTNFIKINQNQPYQLQLHKHQETAECANLNSI